MRNFSEKEIDKYIKFVDEEMIDISEIQGQCHICGKPLKDLKLPKGPEKKVVCYNDLDVFIETIEELEEENLL
ncbi:hypothetical protein AAFL23_12145 [Staphylococcus lugdunensis]|uniref:hypothetical protein n=1 Tax=Staphylococcus TaxID=1279 RepID=UPI0008A86ECE|nr:MULTISPECIES: hypothetical protein [Staphylococcus]MBW7505155.1 hypothetical protein [Streptococcus pneumoniae]MDK8233178.1 hypothetical protein [Staphylococcus lugdunensis]OHO77556.1 hypothetical protein HMPREF2624_02365 [Staphylococcus sp. HMSC055G07]OHQ05964.1 hypothetical protein HMPREF2654_00925 [Staphylococcus sp. HMSC064A09]OHR06744.1 hypothetical protein HMPREF2587_09195 [Staphylococcus sp. HMSC078A08]